MELQLGLALPNPATDHDPPSEARHGINLDLNVGIGGGTRYGCGSQRQQFCQFPEEEGTGPAVPRTLRLLHGAGGGGNGEEEKEEDDDDDYMDTDSSSYHLPNGTVAGSSSPWSPQLGCSNYVKVAMEGIGIGRKVDLSIHHSFHALKDTLLPMFGIYNEDPDNYKLAYQDRGGGHWVVAEDSSWRNFISSAQRLKMVRISR